MPPAPKYLLANPRMAPRPDGTSHRNIHAPPPSAPRHLPGGDADTL